MEGLPEGCGLWHGGTQRGAKGKGRGPSPADRPPCAAVPLWAWATTALRLQEEQTISVACWFERPSWLFPEKMSHVCSSLGAEGKLFISWGKNWKAICAPHHEARIPGSCLYPGGQVGQQRGSMGEQGPAMGPDPGLHLKATIGQHRHANRSHHLIHKPLF